MQASQTPIIWTVVICSIVLLVVGFFMVSSVKNAIPEVPKALTAAEVATLMPKAGDIPTANEIADAIKDKVDLEQYVTGPEVRDTKKEIAYDLVIEEMEDDDFVKDVWNQLRFGEGLNIDDEDDMVFDIKALDEKETEVRIIPGNQGENAWVTLEFNVYYYEDSDDDECGKVRMQVEFKVKDLDRDNDYEDAEIDFRQYLNCEDSTYGLKDRYCKYFD